MMATEPSPDTRSAQRFLVGCAVAKVRDADQLRTLLRDVLGFDVRPKGDSIEIESVVYTVGYEPEGGRTLRIEESCPDCGDPVRSYPIRRHYDVAAFLLGKYREVHEHDWLSGE